MDKFEQMKENEIRANEGYNLLSHAERMLVLEKLREATRILQGRLVGEALFKHEAEMRAKRLEREEQEEREAEERREEREKNRYTCQVCTYNGDNNNPERKKEHEEHQRQERADMILDMKSYLDQTEADETPRLDDDGGEL